MSAGLIMSQCLDSSLQFVLILRVNAASCLVQNDNRRIFQHGTGDGNTLALPTGKVGTGAADNRVIAIVQPADKGVATTLFGGLFHLRVCGAGSSHADILPDTAVKQVVVLRYIGNLICNFRQRYILQLMTAEGNAAGCNIPISGNQLCHRRFAPMCQVIPKKNCRFLQFFYLLVFCALLILSFAGASCIHPHFLMNKCPFSSV